MHLRVSSPGNALSSDEIDAVERDLEKIDRRLSGVDEVFAEVRISDAQSPDVRGFHVVLEVEYRRNHLLAKAEHADMGVAIREAREEILRQINDRSRGGHSSFANRR